MIEESSISPVDAVKKFSQAVDTLKRLGIIRSRRITGELGEWYVEQLYSAQRPPTPTQKGWDLLLPATGEKLQVKTQSFDPEQAWNYLESDPSLFDRLIVLILNEDFTARDLFDIPSASIPSVLRAGKEANPRYTWRDLEPWRVNASRLPGYTKVAMLFKVA